jgi:enamine deaminase RidA (YjgF/YER057c/UK114 family)
MTMTTITRALPWDDLGHETVAHAGVLYIGGVVAEDTGADMTGQAESVLGQLARLLKAGGSDVTRVLQVTIFVTSLADKPAFNEVWKRTFPPAHTPARAMIGVADLGPGVKLELTATAALKR